MPVVGMCGVPQGCPSSRVQECSSQLGHPQSVNAEHCGAKTDQPGLPLVLCDNQNTLLPTSLCVPVLGVAGGDG